MYKRAAFRLIPLFVFAVSFSTQAAERQPAPLPDGMFMHVAVKSPAELLHTLDEAVTIASEGTQYALPPGLLPMIAQMYSPLPWDAWKPEEQADLFVFLDGSRERFAVMVRAESLDSLAKSLEDNDFSVGPHGESGYHAAENSELGEVYFTETEDGNIVFAEDIDGLEQALDALQSWNPVFWGEGVATVDVKLPDGWAEAGFRDIRRALGQIASVRAADEKEIRKVEQFGVNADVAMGFLKLLEKHLPAVLDEIGSLESVAGDLRLDGERIGLETRFGFPGGTFAAALAETAEKRANASSPMLRYVDADASAFNLSAPMTDLLPDAYAKLRAMAEAFYGEVYPDQKDAALELLDNFEKAGIGESVVASYLYLDGQYSASWVKAGNPGMIMDSYPRAIASLNAILDKTILNPSFRLSFSCEKRKTPDGVEYIQAKLVPEKPDEIEGLLDAMEEAGAANMDALRQLLNFTQLVAVKGDTLVMVAGQAGEEELHKALAEMNETADRLIDQDDAAKATQHLRRRQIAFGLADFDAILLYTAVEMAKVYDQATRSDLFTDTLDAVLSDLEASDGFVGFGLGAAGGQLLVDMAMPLHSINTAIRNYEICAAGFAAQIGEHEDGEDEEYEEDGDEEEEGEEEMDAALPFEGPIEAS